MKLRHKLKYRLIDWSKAAPILPERELFMTMDEAHAINNNMVLQGLSTRYILIE
jgi:hypothetical protein